MSEIPGATLSVTHQATITMCSAVTASSSSQAAVGISQEKQLCSSVCHELRTSLQTLTPFLNLGRVLSFSLLLAAEKQRCLQRGVGNIQCLDSDGNLDLFNRSSQADPIPSLCLNLRCHYPLRETNESSHWFARGQAQARGLSVAAQLAFPSAALPFNGSPLNCGLDCVTTTFTASQDEAIRTNRAVFGATGVTFALIAVVAFILNHDHEVLKCLPRRLNVYFNLAYLIGPGTDALLAAGESYKSISCYADNTLRLNQPGGEFSSCILFGAKFTFGAYLMAFFGAYMSMEWYRMIRLLYNSVPVNSFTNHDNLRERIYLVTAVLGSAGLTATLVARNSFMGTPSTGGCLLEARDQFYIFCIPFIILTAIMTMMISHGLPLLFKLHKGISGYIRHLRNLLHGEGSGKNTKSSAQVALENLMALLLLYNVFIIISQLVVVPIYAYTYDMEDDIQKALEDRLACLATSCQPEQCPSLERLSPAVAVMPDTYVNLLGLVSSIWALRWKTYWQEHFERVKSFFRGEPQKRQQKGRTYIRSASDEHDGGVSTTMGTSSEEHTMPTHCTIVCSEV